jgi:hypothetical protein
LDVSTVKGKGRGRGKYGKRKDRVVVPVSIADVSVPNDWIPLINEWPKLHYDKQRQFVNSMKNYKEIMFVAGNGSGKSLIFYWSITALLLGVHPYQKFVGNPPLRIKILVIDFEHGMQKVAQETMFQETWIKSLNGAIGPMFPASMLEKGWTKEDKTLYVKNKSRVEFMTSGQPRQQHSGTNFDVLGCDEEPEEPQYDESKRGLRTAKGGGRILWAYTPPYQEGAGPSWSKYKLFDPWETGDPEVAHVNIIRASMADNPAIDEEYIKWFSQGKTEEQLRVQLRGDFPTWGQMMFPSYEDKEWEPIKRTGHLLSDDWEVPFDDENYRFEMALDWHASKPCAAVWMCEDRDGNIYVYDELSPEMARDKTIYDLADIIRELEGRPQRNIRITRWGDPKMKDRNNALIRGFSAWEEFRNCGIRLAEGYNKQPEVGMSIINDFLRGNTHDHPRLFIRKSCVNTRKAFRNHYWQKLPDGTGKPDPKWSDYPICVRYIVQQKSRKAKKGMFRRAFQWGLTSYSGNPKYGPYTGDYIGLQHQRI